MILLRFFYASVRVRPVRPQEFEILSFFLNISIKYSSWFIEFSFIVAEKINQKISSKNLIKQNS